ncbi:hypothetical protein DMC47_28090 [Nostoc sp. 3335mG]|nr:hypothetical protein DMC47_28090 [Nostoc sp. 3335mG]
MTIPANLLARPAALPQPRRSADGGQDGAAALGSQLDVLDVAGGIRAKLVRLQCAVLAATGQAVRADCLHEAR